MNCLFCDAKDVTSEHVAKCYRRLKSDLSFDFAMLGFRCTERSRDEQGNFTGLRRVDPSRLRWDKERKCYVLPETRGSEPSRQSESATGEIQERGPVGWCQEKRERIGRC
jgi:hypothetical protein